MKKILSLILALLMTASCAATIFADDTAIADTATEETTATEATPYDFALEFLDAKKIMQGWDGELHPEKDVKRYEMAIFATRISSGIVDNAAWEDGPINGTEFTDLEGSGAADALGALSYANQHGIVNGYGDGTFKPENTVTYRDALVMACRTLGYTGLEYKWGYIEKAVTLGLTEGITNVAYTDTINRGVAAQIVYNALFAKTAAGKKLAQESFDFDYEWKKIVVVNDGVRNYVPEAALTAPTVANHVAFKFIEEDGTLSDEVLYVDNVKAGLKFGEFYDAYIGKIGGEYVDFFKAIQIVPGALVTNDGNDDGDGVDDDVTAFLTGKVLVNKYTVRDGNFSLTSSLVTNKGKEIMVVEPGSALVEVGTYVPGEAGSGTYAIDWATGDILEKGDDGKYKVIWHYNEMFGVYFRYKDTNATINNVLGVAGIEVMDDEDLAELKVKIEEAMTKYVSKLGYTVKLAAPTAGYQYSSLLPYDLNGDGAYDYAKYEQYKYGTYSTGNCGHTTTYTLGGVTYYAAKVANCGHCTDAAYAGFSFVEGYKPTTTGEVIYGVNMVTKELKIIKEVLPKGSNTDADTYYAYGVVRGFNMAAKSVIIDGTPYTWGADPAKLNGVTAAPGDNEYFYDSLFNQYVKFVVVDGKLNSIAAQGVGADYIIVERYLGIDNDGYIVIQGYTASGRTLTTFRIASFDGWKVGDAFFYGYNHELEYYFTKGNVYTINSIDATANAYNVTPVGLADEDTGKIVGVNLAGTETKFTFEDNYRITVKDLNADGVISAAEAAADKETITKMAAGDTYVIIGETDPNFNFKPIYLYQGIVPAGWEVVGDLITAASPFIFVNATVTTGFDYEVNKTGFVATLNNRGVQSAYYDEFTADYYYYGATQYTINGFDLLKGTAKDVVVNAYNFKPEKNSVYITIDDNIVDERALSYTEFKAAMTAAYGDGNLKAYNEDVYAAKYIPFSYTFTKDTNLAEFSKWMSNTATGAGYFELTRPHGDLLDKLYLFSVTTAAVKVGNETKDNITAITPVTAFDFTGIDSYDAFCFYDVAGNDVYVYIDPVNDKNPTPAPEQKPADADKATTINNTKLEVVKNEAYITVTPVIEAVADQKGKLGNVLTWKYFLKGLTFSWEGAAIDAMNHTTLEENYYYFGEADACTAASWDAQIGVDNEFVPGDTIALDTKLFDKIIATPYAGCLTDGDDCDLVQSVTVMLKEAIEINAEDWQVVAVSFDTHYTEGVLDLSVKYDLIDFEFTVGVIMEGNAPRIDFALNGYSYNNYDNLVEGSSGDFVRVDK